VDIHQGRIFSAVESPQFCQHNELAIRARDEGDLHKLIAWLKVHGTETDIIKTPEADYCCRVIIAKATWAQYVDDAAANIDYSNFKNTTTSHDPLRHDAYYGCWESLWRWQGKLSNRGT
jgi:hypothetical protein